MDENQSYGDELLKRLNDLPGPDVETAWEDMRRRLEKDDNDPPVIPPVWKGCGVYALLLVLLLIAILFVADPFKWFHATKKEQANVTATEKENKNETIQVEPPSLQKPGTKIIKDTIVKTSTEVDSSKKNNSIAGPDKNDPAKIKFVLKNENDSSENKLRSQHGTRDQQLFIKNISFKKKKNIKITEAASIGKNKKHHNKPVSGKIAGTQNSSVSGGITVDSLADDLPTIQPTKSDTTFRKDSIHTVASIKPGADTVKGNKVDTTIVDKKAKDDATTKKGEVHFAAGLAIHQLVPVAGQKSNPYNASGRKGSLGDYIPAVYLRMYKDEKWFLQSEFRYGAPQYAKEVTFYQKKVVDTFSFSSTTTSNSIKKTFYHQLPVSFNYFVLPGLSIGAGVSLNKFSAALIQQDVYKASTVIQIDTLVSTALINQKKADSNFVTTYLQALIEVQYRWKRLSAGVRYSFGLQPYLKFKLPGGEERSEKNSSLQLFLRYELWRSKKK